MCNMYPMLFGLLLGLLLPRVPTARAGGSEWHYASAPGQKSMGERSRGVCCSINRARSRGDSVKGTNSHRTGFLISDASLLCRICNSRAPGTTIGRLAGRTRSVDPTSASSMPRGSSPALKTAVVLVSACRGARDLTNIIFYQLPSHCFGCCSRTAPRKAPLRLRN